MPAATTMGEAEWNALLATVAEIQEYFPDGVVFIGGIAVHAHVAHRPETADMDAFSHDADFMILLPDMVDLRDIEALTPNRRLGKQQFVKNGFEFDVYVEGQHDLAIPADEAVAESQIRSGLRVACPEHLIILKVKALMDRKGSPKGNKDEDDVIRILSVMDEVRDTCLLHLTDEMLSAVELAIQGSACLRLVDGNQHRARTIRRLAGERFDLLAAAHKRNYPGFGS